MNRSEYVLLPFLVYLSRATPSLHLLSFTSSLPVHPDLSLLPSFISIMVSIPHASSSRMLSSSSSCYHHQSCYRRDNRVPHARVFRCSPCLLARAQEQHCCLPPLLADTGVQVRSDTARVIHDEGRIRGMRERGMRERAMRGAVRMPCT